MSQKRKILIYTHAMAGGGAERVCASLASGFVRRGDDVTLAVDFHSQDNGAYLDPAVQIVQLGSGHVQNVLRLAQWLAREKPDISLSALGISNLKHTIAATFAGRLSRAILSYHGFASNEPQTLSRIAYWLTPLETRMTAATVAVSESLRSYLIHNWRASPGHTRRIYNPVAIRPADTARDMDHPMVLAVGRLAPQKSFLSLIRAFALVQCPNARLVILGEGPKRAAIEAEIARLGLAGRVSLPGYASEPWKMYGEASCFVVSSESETFSLVVVEALANGLPVVSTDCQGPVEILDHGRFGRIVPYNDPRRMAVAIDASLRDHSDPAPRIARASVFSLDTGLDQYSQLFDEVIARHQPLVSGAGAALVQHSGKA